MKITFWVRGTAITLPAERVIYVRKNDPKQGARFTVNSGESSFETEWMSPSDAEEFESNFKRAQEEARTRYQFDHNSSQARQRSGEAEEKRWQGSHVRAANLRAYLNGEENKR